MNRIRLLDDIRGITLLSMILFHAVWDLVHIFGVDWKWFDTSFAYLWQQSICWVFICLSGFCWSLGRRKLQRGLIVFGCGCFVSFVTELVTPNQRVRFGVLTLLGVCMLLMIFMEKILVRVPKWTGFWGSLVCFFLTRNVNDGTLGFEALEFVKLPDELYHLGDIATFIGFTDKSFYSSDYFSVFPWVFLFIAGYFGYRLASEGEIWKKMESWHLPVEFFQKIGKQSLIIYMLHQPVIYLGLSIWNLCTK